MAEFSTPATVPNPSLQDVVLMDFACNPAKQVAQMGAPLTCPLDKPDGSSAFELGWHQQPEFAPLVLNVGKENSQQAWWQGKRASGGSALKTIMKENASRFPSGTAPGRIAAIGFSQGCSGIGEMLRGETDANATDFVYACDGMHAQVEPKSGVVYTASIEPWINFAVRAAQGKTMMVVTHTQIVPYNRTKDGVASTTESAAALLQEVKKRMGYA